MKYLTTVNGTTYEIDVDESGRVVVNGEERAVNFETITRSLFSALIDNASYEVLVEEHEGHYNVLMLGDMYTVDVMDERRQRLMSSSSGFAVDTGEIAIRAPMPGLIIAVNVKEGQPINQGDSLCILESMKMENELKAPRAGTVTQVSVSAGDRVEQNKVVIKIT